MWDFFELYLIPCTFSTPHLTLTLSCYWYPVDAAAQISGLGVVPSIIHVLRRIDSKRYAAVAKNLAIALARICRDSK